MASPKVSVVSVGVEGLVHAGYEYATLDMLGMFEENKLGYEELTPLAALAQWRILPPNWELAPNVDDIKAHIVKAHHWGCSFLVLADGTRVGTAHDDDGPEYSIWLDKHRTKSAYRIFPGFDDCKMKARILMRRLAEPMVTNTKRSASPVPNSGKRQKVTVTDKVWGSGLCPTQWLRDPALQKLEGLWQQADKAKDIVHIDNIYEVADSMSVSGDLRDYRRNLFAKLDQLLEKDKNHQNQDDKAENEDADDSIVSSSSSSVAE